MSSNVDRDLLWIGAYLTALHAMLPRDAPPGLVTSNFSENAQGVADDAVKHFNEYEKQQEGST